jgi:solute:Na+ symporter, SSS family
MRPFTPLPLLVLVAPRLAAGGCTSAGCNPSTVGRMDGGVASTIIFITLSLNVALTMTVMFKKRNQKYDLDTHRAARNSQGMVMMSLSYFVSGVGGLLMFTMTQTAVLSGGIGLLGYALSLVIPLRIFGAIAPYMRKNLPKGFTFNEYVYGRFGRVHTVYVAIIALFYMETFMTAELIAACKFATTLSNIETQDQPWWDNSMSYGTVRYPMTQWDTDPHGTFYGNLSNITYAGMPITPVLGTSLITMSYTIVGGMPVSMLTDGMQGLAIFTLSVVTGFTTWAVAGIDEQSRDKPGVPEVYISGPNRFLRTQFGAGVHPLYGTSGSWSKNDSLFGNSILIAISLILGEICAKFLHAGYWQRMWAAESDAAVRRGTHIASFLSVLIILAFGPMGCAAFSHLPWLVAAPAGESPMKDFSSYALPWLVNYFGWDWLGMLVLAVGISMVASTCDTLQSGMIALFLPLSDMLFGRDQNESTKLVFVLILMALLNLPPAIFALSGQAMLEILMLAKLVAATIIPSLFLGLWERTHPHGAIAGAIAGLVSLILVLSVGIGGETFDQLMQEGGYYSRLAAFALIIVSAVSAVVTVAVSVLCFPGYRFQGYADAAGDGAASGTHKGPNTSTHEHTRLSVV